MGCDYISQSIRVAPRILAIRNAVTAIQKAAQNRFPAPARILTGPRPNPGKSAGYTIFRDLEDVRSAICSLYNCFHGNILQKDVCLPQSDHHPQIGYASSDYNEAIRDKPVLRENETQPGRERTTWIRIFTYH